MKRRIWQEEGKEIWEASRKMQTPGSPDLDNAWKQLSNRIQAMKGMDAKKRWTLGIPWRVARPAYAVALASIVIALGVFTWQSLRSDVYRTGRQQRMSVVLPDGSTLQLNHDTRVSFRHGLFDNTRSVTLDGEAFFSVRTDKDPFVITTSVGTIRVVGTEFNAKSRMQRLEVAVQKGIVEISTAGQGSSHKVRLTKGEITACRLGEVPDTPRSTQFDQYPGWLHGKILMYQTPVRDVCREIEEVCSATVQIEDSTLGSTTLTGVLEGDDPARLISTLCSLTGRQYRKDHETFVIF